MINCLANVSSGSNFRSYLNNTVLQEYHLFHSWLPLKPMFDQGSSAFCCHLMRTSFWKMPQLKVL